MGFHLESQEPVPKLVTFSQIMARECGGNTEEGKKGEGD